MTTETFLLRFPIVVPSLVYVLLVGLVEDDEQLRLGIVQINFVYLRLHRFSPL